MINKADNLQDPNILLQKKQQEVAKKLNIDINEPKQEKRIQALTKLYNRYLGRTTVPGFIYCDIIDCYNKLIDIYTQQEEEIEQLKKFKKSSLFLKTKLESVNFKNQGLVSELEERILFNKQLLVSYENKYINSLSISDEYRNKLKEIEDEAWDNWLKLLDINRELRNNIIGYENRKTIFKVGKSYVDYHIFVEDSVKNCFERLKDFKKDGIVEYYEILSHFEIPTPKLQDFQLFLQKKIESKLDDAVEIKSSFGKSLENSHYQIDQAVNAVHNQFLNSKRELASIINYYKNFLLQKQVLFTKEAEELVVYIKQRYFEKIDMLCSSFNKYNTEIKSDEGKLDKKDISLLQKFFKDEFEIELNKLKIKYSEKFIPLLDNFWHTEKTLEKEYAFDRNLFNENSLDLKKLKVKNMKFLISKFDDEKAKIEKLFEDKHYLLDDVEKLNVQEFNRIIESLKKDCEDICAEIISVNHRFWVKANAEFNCEARKFLVKLHYQYAPWLNDWRVGGRAWMHDYLIFNLNSEVLKVVGTSLKDYSPESELYLKVSEALFKYNEYSRKLFKERDDMEFNMLMEINSVPDENLEGLLSLSNQKVAELEKKYTSYWENYNNFYNFLIS